VNAWARLVFLARVAGITLDAMLLIHPRDYARACARRRLS
jgi:hypothetical protein